MASGIPVVATDVGGNREILKDESVGLLVAKGDHRAVAGGICGLLSDKPRCIKMRRNARRYVKQEYSWKVNIKKLESYYENLV